MAITAETRNDIIELVVTAYNAAPGTTLLTELVAIVDGGGTLADVATALTTSSRWTSLYPSFQTAEEFANEWLGNLVPEASAEALAEGVSVAVGLLNSGSTFAALVMEAQSFLSAAAEDDASFGTSAANFNNKVEVATNHTVTLEKDGTEDELANVLSTVTSDDTTVTAANESEAATATGGETYTLTSKIDNITGTTSDDTINGIFSATASEESYNLTDTIDGGAGTDTLNINFILSADVTRTGQSASNVEIVNIKSTDGNTASNTATFTMSGVTGETQVWVRDNTVIGSNDDTISVNSITDGATLGLASNDSDLDVNFTTTGAATSADTVALAVAGGSTGDVVINDAAGDGYATINLTTSGSAGSIGTLKSTDLTTLNILGDQKFTSLGLDSDITTLDASANTAGVTVNATAGTKLKATGTAAADTLALTVGSSVISGMAIADFETVSFYASASSTVDADLITGASTLALSSVTGAHGNVLTYQDAGASTTFAALGAGKSTSTGDHNGLTLTMKDAAGTADSLVLSFNNLGVDAGTNDAQVGQITADGVETVTIAADNWDDLTVATGTSFAAAKTITLTGDADVNFTDLSAAALTSFAGGSSTGDTTLGTLDNIAVSSVITTGSGKDNLSNAAVGTANKTQTINTGAGNDTLTVVALTNATAKVDADLGDGDDTVNLPTGGDVNGGVFEIDAGAGTDKLVISGALGAGRTYDIDEFDNFEEITLAGTGNATTLQLDVPTGYADTLEVTDVSGQTETITVTASVGGTASLANWTFLGWTSGTDVINLNGSTGNETLTGTSQQDSINGGTGADTMTGGAGADTFVIATTDSINTALDKITDYVQGTDVLDLNTNVTSTAASTGADLLAGTNIASTGTTAATLLTDLQTVADALAANGFDEAGDTFTVTLTGSSVGGTDAKYVVHNAADDTTVTAADTIIQLSGTSNVPTAAADII